MSDPNPNVGGTGPGLTPSGSTNASAVGGAIAVLVIAICHMRGIDFPAGVEAAIATIVTIVAGYLPASGRK